jgi:hypothetical protein
MTIDLTKPENEILVDLINQSNGTTLTAAMLTFSSPQVQNGLVNTRILASAVPNMGATGEVYLTYHRKDIVDIVGSQNKTFTPNGETTVLGILPLINEEYEINLGVEDVIDASLPVFPEDETVTTLPFVFTIAPGSLIYHGTIQLRVRRSDVNLSNIINNTELGGGPMA